MNEKLRRTREELAAAERDLEAIRLTIQRQADAIAAESKKADAADRGCQELAAAIEEWKNRMIQVIERATTLRNDLNYMDSGRRQELARRSRLLGQLAEKSTEVERIDEGVIAMRPDWVHYEVRLLVHRHNEVVLVQDFQGNLINGL